MKNKPAMNYRTCKVAYVGSILILLSIIWGCQTCNGQSIALNLNVHSNGSYQYGIAIHNMTHCCGVYYNRIAKECYNSDHQLHKGADNIGGYSAGIIITTYYERVDYVSCGVGKLIKQHEDTHTSFNTEKFFFEVRSGIILKDWLTIDFGINNYPAVVTGVVFKLNLR